MGKELTEQKLIEGVIVTRLNKFEDERGMLLHMIRRDAPHFHDFGEVYFSVTNPGVTKGWKLHLEMIQNFAVPVGELKLVLFDARENSATKGIVNEFSLSLENYQLITIPNNLWYSFRTTSKEPSMIANCASLAHRDGEAISKEITSSDIPYEWN